MAAALELIRMTNALLAPIAPGASGWVAQRLFTTPRRHRPPTREHAAEEGGERLRFRAALSGAPEDGMLSALRFGHGRGPRILAMHGWEGRATQWGPLATAATAAGFELIAIDAPGHGHSPGRRAHPRSFMDALLAADAEFGPFHAIIGHSMGGAAAATALSRGLRAERAVLIASPASPARIMRNFSGFIGLEGQARERFYARMERTLGLPPDALELPAFELEQPVLVVHSRDDKEIEFSNADQLTAAWPRSEQLSVDGLGHRRIIRSPEVIAAALDFLAR